jgi:hypothetical protein
VEAADSDLGYANTLLVAKALAMTGLDLIEDPGLLGTVKDAFQSELARRQAAG